MKGLENIYKFHSVTHQELSLNLGPTQGELDEGGVLNS